MEKPHKYNASAFAFLVPVITELARKHGYAIGLHGSMQADLDLMAIPWVENPSPAAALVEAIRKRLNGMVLMDGSPGGKWSINEQAFVPVCIAMPEKKPHGRLAWNINLNGGMRIDLSVMPISDTPNPGIAGEDET